jgi:hypothetical protein
MCISCSLWENKSWDNQIQWPDMTGKEQIFFTSPSLRGPSSHLPTDAEVHSGWRTEFTTSFHLLPRFRLRRQVHSRPRSLCMTRCTSRFRNSNSWSIMYHVTREHFIYRKNTSTEQASDAKSMHMHISLNCMHSTLIFTVSCRHWTHIKKNSCHMVMTRRSQWPRGLRHELSSLARTLGSCVRVPLEAWMSVCVYSVFVLFCM